VTYFRATRCRSDFLYPLNLLLNFTCFSALVLIAGCASRHATADRQPVPSGASPGTTESAKRSSDAEPAPTPANPPARPSPRRDKSSPSPAPAGYLEEGNASWYGVPFNGRRASNGEIYDMYKLTAAHRTLPFETMVRVTNLNNGKATTVRITDRGPFVENRIIDLSLAAAREIESIGPGAWD
jgi:rare lipoprotein A